MFDASSVHDHRTSSKENLLRYYFPPLICFLIIYLFYLFIYLFIYLLIYLLSLQPNYLFVFYFILVCIILFLNQLLKKSFYLSLLFLFFSFPSHLPYDISFICSYLVVSLGLLLLCSILLGSKHVNLTSMDQEGAYPRGELQGRLPLTDGRGTVLKAIHSGLIVGHIHH